MIMHQELKISLRQMVDNPSGKGSAYLAKRAMIKQGLNLTYIKILQRYRKQFYATPYLYDDGRILFHVKVPSEMYNLNKISYDVIFEFENDPSRRLSLRNMKCFSNSPSFIFTYAYVFNAKKILIDKFKSNLPYECLTIAPKTRNPVESMGYEKSIYLAARYLLDSNALTDAYIRKFGKPCNTLVEKDILRRIANPQTLIAVYHHALYLNAKSHRKPISSNELKQRNERARRFEDHQKRVRPESRRGILGIKMAPRAKINARKATRAIMNDNSRSSIRKSRTIRAKKKV